MRPDYVTCIRQTLEDKRHLSWCGLDVSATFVFVNIDHAANNAVAQGRLLTCSECLDAVMATLESSRLEPDVEFAEAPEPDPPGVDHDISVVSHASGTLFRWKCSCGSGGGGTWRGSPEEAQKQGDRHKAKASLRG